MANKVYVVTDLGPGDGGKGSVVHRIATLKRAHTIIKVGGAQGSHGVCTSTGQRFAFSQWGCGTLENIRTHLSSHFIVSPEGLLNEANALRYEQGIYNPFALLTIDQAALCATPYHGIASRLKEMSLGYNPRGTIGTGVGEAYRYSQKFPELAIFAGDLSQINLSEKLIAIRSQIISDLNPIIESGFLPEDRALAEQEIKLLYDDGLLNYIVQRFKEVNDQVTIVGSDFLGEEILSQDGIAVVESSHGVLTDHHYGFHPHTSAISTLPCFTRKMIEGTGYSGEIINIGVTRAYQIRHGAGPMPTSDSDMLNTLLPGSCKLTNRYQGEVRVGPLDLILLRYAIAVCGGPTAFDGLAITWFDQIQKNGQWNFCNRYHNTNNQKYFTKDGDLQIYHGDKDHQLKYQAELGQQLLSCIPQISTQEIPSNTSRDELRQLCSETLYKSLNVPVRMVSFGPTEQDKLCL